jgi:CelD/BcsL family acetyltransferase involved in cellulose biosynthesis
MAGASALAVTLSHDPDALFALQAEWEELLADSISSTIFMTWEWMTEWWKAHGQGRQLWLLQARNSEGRLVGLAPLMLCRHVTGPVRWHELLLVSTEPGLGDPDHMDFIVARGHEEAVLGAFRDALCARRSEWDVLSLIGLRCESPTREYFTDLGVEFAEEDGEACPSFPLPASWHDYEYGVLDKTRRHEVRRYVKRLESELGERARFSRVENETDLGRVLKAICEARQQHSRETGAPNAFETPEAKAFHRQVGERFLRRGWLHAVYLEIDGIIAAWLYGFKYNGIAYGYQTGFDPQWGRYAPGQLIFAYGIQTAIEQGLHSYDLLRGGEGYKKNWACDKCIDTNLHVIASERARGKMSQLATMRQVWQGVKRILPPAVRTQMRRSALGTKPLSPDRLQEEKPSH